MNCKLFSGKPILLLGKTRFLAPEEFEKLLKLHAMTCVGEYDDGVALIVEGRMMDPYEQAESARLYEEKAAPIVSIDSLEEWLCRSIEPNRLLMSLKLSRDQERLVAFLQNPYITDPLFFKLLPLYDWQNEGLFDNDRNRDVTAAIIGRFYLDRERNHNVQYAMSGLAHLIERYGNEELIGAIAGLSPIAKELNTPSDRTLGGVLDAMALHGATPEGVLRQLMEKRPALLARREPLRLEGELLASGRVDEVLACNPTLSTAGADCLVARYPEAIAEHHPLTPERFDALQDYGAALGKNRSLSVEMQQRLMERGEEAILASLAGNPSAAEPILESLYGKGGFEAPLASNPSLPFYRLEELSRRSDPAVLEALASNPSTPIEILYQLSLDRRFERGVKTNPAFGKHIQTHNIGWH